MKNNQKTNLILWYSSNAKSCYYNAVFNLEKLKYTQCIQYCQDSIESSLKAILLLHNITLKNVHDVNDYFDSPLFEKHTDYHKDINEAKRISAERLNSGSRSLYRYGIKSTDTPPNKIDFNKLKYMAENIKTDAKFCIDFLKKIEKDKKWPIYIGILNGHIYGPENDMGMPIGGAQVDDRYTSEKWKEGLCKIKLKKPIRQIDLINAYEIDNRYTVIINPFGENYPEVNLEKQTVFNSIKEYIQLGGIFVNIGGLPFWKGINVSIKERPYREYVYPWIVIGTKNDGTPYHEQINNSLNSTPVWTHFEVQTTGDTEQVRKPKQFEIKEFENGNPFNSLNQIGTKVTECRAIRNSTKKIIPMLKVERPEPDFGEVYPIAAKQFGEGYFIICGMKITNDFEFEIVIKAIELFLNLDNPEKYIVN